MALTKTGTDGIKDDAITLDKLAHGTSSQDGKFLRANNGSAPTFETVNTDLVSDSSPQLGADLDTNSHNILLDDNHKVNFGDSSDLQIYYDGTDSFIYGTTGTRQLKIRGQEIRVVNEANTEVMAKFIEDGAVQLYHNNVKKFQTDSAGASLFGNLYQADNDKLILGTGSDLQLYHDGSDSFIKNTGVGGIRIDSVQTVLRNAAGTEHIIETTQNGSVDLFHNGSKKIETTSYGTKVTGYQSSTTFVGFHVRGTLSDTGFGTNHGSGITTYDLAYMSPIPMFNNRVVQSGSNYLSFPSYAGGTYLKFTAPVAGLYQFELIASVETHHGGDWCALGFEKNITSTYSNGELQNNFEGAIAIYERAGGDEGMGSHFACTRFLDANDYVVLYQQSVEAIRFKNNVYAVRGHLIH